MHDAGQRPLESLGAESALTLMLIKRRQSVSEQNSVVAIYSSHSGAEEAVKELQRGGIDMHSLSIIGKDTHTDEHVVGYYNTGDRMKYWGKTGAFWGGSGDYSSERHSSQFLA